MQQFKERSEAEKYLKATSAASYHSEIAVNERFGWSGLTGLKEAFNSVFRRASLAISEYAISNAFVLAFLASAKSGDAAVSRKAATINRLQFIFNWVIAVVGLLCLLPLFGLVAVAIKLDSAGPVFYKQERVGLNRRRGERRQRLDGLLNCARVSDRRQKNVFGKPFFVYKFRTMVTDAEKRCGPIWATKNDPRITRLGRILRKTRIDEFPQLINVLKGEMSIVGPRPERPFFIEKFSSEVPDYTRRLEVLPGITGLAQVVGGYDTSIDDVKKKVSHDLEYIRSSSIRSDVLIMFRTVGVMLGARGM
jgi:lipopolysaccharide/colanic/teichoic acid biosynthesis glycosyltransferase